MQTKYISALILFAVLLCGCQEKSAQSLESTDFQNISTNNVLNLTVPEEVEESPVATSKLGDPAKNIHVSEWIKGNPVSVTDKKNIYVIVCWATWCGPCKESIPHLTELQKKYADKRVVFVGISSEDAAEVKPFVEEMGDSMDYHVAIDKDNQTFSDYLLAFGQDGIPAAFVIDLDGRVAWFGHPLDGLEETLDSLIAGNYDLQKLVEAKDLEDEMDKLGELLVNKDPNAAGLSEELLQKSVGNQSSLTYLLQTAHVAMSEEYFNKVLDELAKIPAVEESFVTSRKLSFYTRLYGHALMENDSNAAQNASKSLLDNAETADVGSLISASYLLSHLVKTEEDCTVALQLLDIADKKLEPDNNIPPDFVRGLMKIKIGKREEGKALLNKSLAIVKDEEIKESLQYIADALTDE